MGMYDRHYFRDSSGGSGWGLDGLTPVVKFILLANVAVFLLQIFITREQRLTPVEMLREMNPELDRLLAEKEAEGPEAVEQLKKDYPELAKLLEEEQEQEKRLDRLLYSPTKRVSILQEWCELDTHKVVHQGQVWRMVTHAFCHDRYGIFHILFNMLLLYWFGGTLESMYGSREFLFFYLTSALAAALAFVALDLYTGSSIPGIGASGAVVAVMMLYTMHFPREIIYVCWIFPLEMRWVMALYLIWDLHPILLTLSGDRIFTGIAHAAHLGGLAFGYLYARYEWWLDPLLDRVAGMFPRFQQRPRLRLVAATDPEMEPDAEATRVDDLLQKILHSGEASLTDEDRAFLREASNRRSKRRQSGG